ncbi:hypothetical protein BA953_00870 [Vibrio coralliilyticus]|nr:hypothetical protein BA953_00870 [Vibrio coralliilyticus]
MLSRYSKDFRCVCYYAVSAVHNRGIEGLLEGLNSILDMCIIYWLNGFPEEGKNHARLSSFNWYIENILRKKQCILDERDKSLLEFGLNLSSCIHNELQNHYGRGAPAFDSLITVFSRRLEEIAANESKEASLEPSVFEQPVAAKQTEELQIEDATDDTSHNNMVIIFTSIMIIFFAYFFLQHQENEIKQLKVKIGHYSNEMVLSLMKSTEDQAVISAIKPDLYKKLNDAVLSWGHRSMRTSKREVLLASIQEFKKLYPESNKAIVLERDFMTERDKVNQEFSRLEDQFKKARTVFANLKVKKGALSEVQQSYHYSNSLFPLLGRINFAEAEQSMEELDKAQYILNVYQHKISELRDELTSEQ